MAKQFGDLSTNAALQKLEAHLEGRSYITGYTASQEDATAFKAISSIPEAFICVQRWYNHIKSMSGELTALPGVPAAAAKAPQKEEDDDSDVDLFGSDDEEEDAEAARIREERLAAYAEKKSKKPGPVAKSQILLDVKPWDDETDMKELEKAVRSIALDGLVWGAGELKPVGFGIKKLSILATVVDALVGVDDLSEKIEEFEDYVQSVDVAAFNKV